jgi:hypothetical protein
MTQNCLANGKLQDLPREDVQPINIVDDVTIFITDLTPWKVACDFDKPAYRAQASPRTPFDLTYRHISAFGPGKFIRATYQLDRDLAATSEFIPPSPSAVLTNQSVTCSNATAHRMLLNLDFAPTAVSFLIRYLNLAKGDYATFCLGLRFRNPSDPSYSIDIFYDPTVPNDGS